ncbi:MAG: hydrolase [Bacteroidetes bacterium HGW-Bacteroidetes-8]|jgi:putative nucleotidyltransferase with HDIG domain|nr:MAG: hydrolase [Bacteroidetes bacterium HGW-Bacteroidetes-8]
MKSREYYLDLLSRNVNNPKMIAHSLASEAVLRALAERLGEDVDLWGVAGLLHDIDVEITSSDPKRHSLVGAEMLEAEGLPQELVDAVKMHNEMSTGLERSKRFQYALAAGETVTGLIFATALVQPDKKISSVKVKSVVKRMKEKLFAASVNRDTIMECEKFGIPLDQFVALSIEALLPVAPEFGM